MPAPWGSRVRSWTEELATGISEIDAQHRDLYAHVAALLRAVEDGHLYRVVKTLGHVEQYVDAHFTTEERCMRLAAYPRLEEHRALHEAFVAEFRERERRLLVDEPWRPLVIEISEWLGAWLRDHVGAVDAEMARFLRAVRSS